MSRGIPSQNNSRNNPSRASKSISEKAADYLRDWAEVSARPSRNGHQIELYIKRANAEDMVAAVAFVRKRKGFPHSNEFHLLMDKVEISEIDEARQMLGSWEPKKEDAEND